MFKVTRVAKQIKFIRNRFITQIKKDQIKLEYLKNIWRAESVQVKLDLLKDAKTKAGRLRLKEY